MTISYEMKPSDIWALNRYVYTHVWRATRFVCLVVLLVPMATLFVNLCDSHLPRSSAWLFAAIALLIWAPFVYGLLRIKALGQLRMWPAHLRRIEMAPDEDAIHVTTPKISQTTAWDAVLKVRRDRHAIYLFISPRMAHIIPLRAFASSADADACEDFATRMLASAR